MIENEKNIKIKIKNLLLNGFLDRPRLDPLAREQIAELKNKNVGNIGEKTQPEKLSADEEPGDEKTIEDNSPVDEESSLLDVAREDTSESKASDQDQEGSSNNSEDSRANFLPPPTQTRFVGKLQQMRGTKVAEPTLILNNHLNLIYSI